MSAPVFKHSHKLLTTFKPDHATKNVNLMHINNDTRLKNNQNSNLINHFTLPKNNVARRFSNILLKVTTDTDYSTDFLNIPYDISSNDNDTTDNTPVHPFQPSLDVNFEISQNNSDSTKNIRRKSISLPVNEQKKIGELQEEKDALKENLEEKNLLLKEESKTPKSSIEKEGTRSSEKGGNLNNQGDLLGEEVNLRKKSIKTCLNDTHIGLRTSRVFSESNRSLASHEKRNKEVHKLFKNLPEDDYYVDDFKCALQKDILLQGCLFLTERHFCFYAKIFGFVTTLVIPISEVQVIEKKLTLRIPNAISLNTKNSWYFFTSFISRDIAFKKMDTLFREVNDLEDAQSLPNSNLEE
ncbi:hypothetical protein HK099_001597, partial [Clydaea vesicula]